MTFYMDTFNQKCRYFHCINQNNYNIRTKGDDCISNRNIANASFEVKIKKKSIFFLGMCNRNARKNLDLLFNKHDTGINLKTHPTAPRHAVPLSSPTFHAFTRAHNIPTFRSYHQLSLGFQHSCRVLYIPIFKL